MPDSQVIPWDIHSCGSYSTYFTGKQSTNAVLSFTDLSIFKTGRLLLWPSYDQTYNIVGLELAFRQFPGITAFRDLLESQWGVSHANCYPRLLDHSAIKSKIDTKSAYPIMVRSALIHSIKPPEPLTSHVESAPTLGMWFLYCRILPVELLIGARKACTK